MDDIILRCVFPDEYKMIMEELHVGVCGGHYSSNRTTTKIMREGYDWPTSCKEVI